MTYTFKVSLQEEDDGRWSAWIDSLPGCAAWGHTRDEALEALQEGAEAFVECMRENGDPIPEDQIETDTPTRRCEAASLNSIN